MTAGHRDRFYAERDRRTKAYGVTTDQLNMPVRISVGTDAAETPAGQALTVSLINMVCRLHRRVELVLPDTALLVPTLVPAKTLAEAGEALALAIDPYINLASNDKAFGPTIAIGDTPGTYWLGSDGYIGHLATSLVPLTNHPAGILGAGMAASLGAAALLQAVTGAPVRERSVSLWGFGEIHPLVPGPSESPSPINVGENIALVGAGAVGSAILYWLNLVDVQGDWIVVDKDIVELHNTNRSLGMLASHAGWPNGIPGGPVATKAEIGAALIGATPENSWYDEWIKTSTTRFDLLIPAGGERNIRSTVGQLGLPLMVQGATSPGWQVQLHRHGPKDSCPACRFPTQPTVDLACSTGSMTGPETADDEQESPDAALPFLSAAAGLLVVAALTQLEHGYLNQSINQHGLMFGSGVHGDGWLNTIVPCRSGCTRRPPLSARRRLNAGRRWAAVDN